jgi:type II secretory pathway pseudopilin PulG
MRAVNLIPVEDREGAAVGAGRSEGAAYAVMGLILGIALLVVLYGSAKKQVESRTSQAASVAAQAQSAQAQATQLASYTTFAALHEQREQAVDTLVDSRFDWAHAFHELGRVITPFVTINTLTGTVSAASATIAGPAAAPAAGAAPAGAATAAASGVTPSTPPGSVPSISLVGCAITQKDVADFLVRLRLIDGVSSVALATSSLNVAGSAGCGTRSYSFTITVDFDPLPTTIAETASALARKPKTVADSAPSASGGAAGTGAPASSASSGTAQGAASGSVSAATSAAVAASGAAATTPSTTTSAAGAPSGSSTAPSSSQSSTPAASTSGSVVR